MIHSIYNDIASYSSFIFNNFLDSLKLKTTSKLHLTEISVLRLILRLQGRYSYLKITFKAL